MEHWFDKITKLSACDQVTRRDVFKAALFGVGAAPLLFGDETVQAAATPAPGIRIIGVGAAAVAAGARTSGAGTRIRTVSASTKYKGQPLTLRSVHTEIGGPFPELTVFVRVDLGSNLLYEASLHSVPGFRKSDGRITPAAPAVSADIRYGPAIRGPRHLVLKASKGVVQGFADGHLVSNGTPATVTIDAYLQRSLQDLWSNARSNLASARTPEEVSNACDNCGNDCSKAATQCGINAVATGLSNPVAGFLALGGCVKDEYDCNTNCSREGGPCCSVRCSSGFCCGTDQFCCWSAGGGETINGPACCDNGAVCTSVRKWGDWFSYCCPAGSDPNGCVGGDFSDDYFLYCHNPGEVCCGNRACTTAQFCADAYWSQCCSQGQSFCAGYCCSGKCLTYNSGTSAEYQVCCSQQSVCGDSCCPPNEKCLTSSTGKKVCCDHPLCGEECCAPGEICSNGHCGWGAPCGNGPPCGFAICCNGVCCEFNQTCVNGKCTGTTCPPGKVPCPVTPNQCCPPNFQCCGNNTCCDRSTTECCGSRGCVPLGGCIQ